MIRPSNICLLLTHNPYVSFHLKEYTETCNVYAPNYTGVCYDGNGINFGTGCHLPKFKVDYSIMYGSSITSTCGKPTKSYIVFNNTNFSTVGNTCIAFSRPIDSLNFVKKSNAAMWGTQISSHTQFMVAIAYAISICDTVRVYGASLKTLHSDEYGMITSAFADGKILPVC